ncbi:hypothetical protein BJY04DRAFT_184260 [Aspergillus karnatakaensis]|uniref:uncharacterized protein n=1 Tax=Aspergillus karnatakaensis TaxID=1810916 RepID=UPI003CCD5809
MRRHLQDDVVRHFARRYSIELLPCELVYPVGYIKRRGLRLGVLIVLWYSYSGLLVETESERGRKAKAYCK